MADTKPLEGLIKGSLKRTFDMFAANQIGGTTDDFFEAQRVRVAVQVADGYARSNAEAAKEDGSAAATGPVGVARGAEVGLIEDVGAGGGVSATGGAGGPGDQARGDSQGAEGGDVSKALASLGGGPSKPSGVGETSIVAYKRVEAHAAAAQGKSRAIVARKLAAEAPKPKWHAPWKLMRVIQGHGGWVRSVAVDHGNQWFVTGAADRTIKVWDLASGTLKLTLTGHINAIRGLAVSSRHPYMFSAGEDKKVLCWDLEVNKVIRSYHGHLSGVYSLSLHPTIDVLITGGRDAVARVWDMRTKQQVHVLGGHTGAVNSIVTNSTDPQVITGSQDKQVRLWDLAAGKAMGVLTHHKKGVRALATHPREFTFMSGAADSIKKWKLPDAELLKSFRGHDAIVNTLGVTEDDVLFSGADNGSMRFWDYKTGYCFQETETKPAPGSLDSEAGIFASTFDRTGTRLITCEADKTIKVWKEDPTATPESHPVDMLAWTAEWRKFRRY